MITPDVGGIVLSGGQSSRMQRPKAWLPFCGQALLQRVVEVLQRVVAPVVVVAAPGQILPELPETVEVVRDREKGLGPLAGIAAGLDALSGKVAAAYIASCDAPLIQEGFVEKLVRCLGDAEIVVPREGTLVHPLAAVYRTELGKQCLQLLNEGKRRPLDLIRASHARYIDVAELRNVDPQLRTLLNVNTPAEYGNLLQIASGCSESESADRTTPKEDGLANGDAMDHSRHGG